MADNPALLVVDDEEVVCHACRRIFSRQGFQVEVNTDAREGLAWATEKDYAIILLDIKMPNMDGIEFLERLRQKKPDVPVLIITGYPSIPNAASAMRLGACDYVTKPFTSEEITRAVQRVLATHRAMLEEPAAGAGPGVAAASEILFWEESWFRLEADGSASIGAVLPGLRRGTALGVRLPRIGEAVYQGLPLAGVSAAGKPVLVVPSPLSGIVVAVNDQLVQRPEWLLSDPCGEGWIACVCATRYEDEVGNCKRRRVLLVSADPASADGQAQKLAALGCQVDRAADRDGVAAALRNADGLAVMLDAASLGENGPKLASLVNTKAATARIVVVASPGDAWESAYRKEKIFYYAVEPFSDNEIADILTAVFRGQEAQATKAERAKGPSEPISAISITNRNCHKVQLLAAPGLLWRNEGLGLQIGQRLLAQMFPVVITPGEANLTPANILKMAGTCDRVMVLLARDSGLLPGGLARDTKPEFGVEPGEAAGKVTFLAVEPDSMGGFAGLEARNTAALAEHIVREMASY